MPTNNSSNINATGLANYNGTGTFTGVTTTNHNLLIGLTGNSITNVAPSATSGVPVISQGASVDPTFGTAVVAGGGTGVTSATAYAVITGGTTSTNPLQSVASVGTSGQVLTSNGASALPSFQGAPAPASSASATVSLVDDFMINKPAGSNTELYGNLCWTNPSATGLCLGLANATENNRPGLIANSQLAVATTNSGIVLGGRAAPAALYQLNFILGGGTLTVTWYVKTATLSTGTNRYILRAGIGDTLGADQVNGCYFEYSDNINSGNWVSKTASASTRTTTNSSTAVGTGWSVLQLVVNADASSVAFSVNGANIATIATNIPTTAITPFLDTLWVAGTVPASSILVDLFTLSQPLTTPR